MKTGCCHYQRPVPFDVLDCRSGLGRHHVSHVADVILREFKMPIVGTYEIVSLLGAIVIGFAIPQTSLERGHVLMDFLTERLPFGWTKGFSCPVQGIGHHNLS